MIEIFICMFSCLDEQTQFHLLNEYSKNGYREHIYNELTRSIVKP